MHFWVVPDGRGELKTITGISAGSGTRFKGIFYAPGCALQMVEMPITEGRPYQYFFTCETLPQIEIDGIVLRRDDPLPARSLRIEAKYVANWASGFFGYDDGTTTEIPLDGEATWAGNGRLRLELPDFSKDAVGGSANRDGEIRIWIRDKASGQILDQLRVSADSPANQRTRFGGIPIGALHFIPVVFSLCPSDTRWAHDKYGFAIRTNETAGCELLPWLRR